MGHAWLGPALRAQSMAALAVMAAFSMASAAGLDFGIGIQLGVLLGGMVVTGMPHGAFDHLVARRVLAPRLGRFWAAPFLAGYLGLAGVVWLAWMLAPAATLAAFLAISVAHFGLGDTEDGLAPSTVPRVVTVLAYGALPLLLPMALHPAEAAPVLAAMAGVPDAVMERTLRAAVWLLPAWAAAFGWVAFAAWRERRGVAERLATVACFVLLPPLLSFGLYFGLGHAIRHMLRLGAWHDPRDPRAAARWLARTAIPAGAACAASLGAMALAGLDTTVALLTPGFRLIAALTLPHMAVTAWLDGHPPNLGRHGAFRTGINRRPPMPDTETPKPAGTASAPNLKTGSSDAARGVGGHSKDASHEPGAPAEYVEKGQPTPPKG